MRQNSQPLQTDLHMNHIKWRPIFNIKYMAWKFIGQNYGNVFGRLEFEDVGTIKQ
jgi:hypothetical protein